MNSFGKLKTPFFCLLNTHIFIWQCLSASDNLLTINIDGASRGNPGLSGIGVVISRDGQKIAEYKEFVGNTTNNLAEYLALKKALKIASTLNDDEITILSDSELVVKQRNRSYKVRSKQLKMIFREVNNLEKYFRSVSYRHVPRENNSAADLLANRAIDEYVLNIDKPNDSRQQ
jgi:ribonuclease HI